MRNGKRNGKENGKIDIKTTTYKEYKDKKRSILYQLFIIIQYLVIGAICFSK